MFKAYTIRLYPTKNQEELFIKHAGCCRFIWNYMLGLQLDRFHNGEKYLQYYSMSAYLTQLKKQPEYQWLNEVGSHSLIITLRDFDQSYVMALKKKARLPKFKRKKDSKVSFPVRYERLYFSDEMHIHIEKVGKVKCKTDLRFPVGRNKVKLFNPQILKRANKWLITFAVECENQAPTLTEISMGIDLGVKDLAVVEYNGEKIVFHNINKSKRMRQLEKKSKRLHRSISRKYNAQGKKSFKKTKNIEREEALLKAVYAKMSNIRHNYIHQVTHSLVELLPKRVVMEDLNISGMMKNRHLSRAIGEQNFSLFLWQMKYKSEFYGIEFVKADRFYPSSKTCSSCGSVKTDLKLRDREFICPECGLRIDRDYNAAINLSRYIV